MITRETTIALIMLVLLGGSKRQLDIIEIVHDGQHRSLGSRESSGLSGTASKRLPPLIRRRIAMVLEGRPGRLRRSSGRALPSQSGR
jgi:hypothetical protein